MSYFQNPFAEDFNGVWVLGDRQASLTFKCPRNAGRNQDLITAFEEGPFNLSGNDTEGDSKAVLVIKLSLFPDFRGWSTLSVNVGSGTAVTSEEIVTALNANAPFAGWFTAGVNSGRVYIRSNHPLKMRFFVVNGRAETALRFNARSGVAELPSYFSRHTIDEVFNFDDSSNILVELDTSNTVDAAVIDDAEDPAGRSKGFDSSDVQEDWELLTGRSGLFQFQKLTVDGSNRITQIIEYSAGAIAGDLAKKTTYSYTAAKTNPDKMCQVPYTLESGDLVTP